MQTETLIIGAGPAGALAAAWLVRAGKRALVIEKEAFPRFSIGESLLPVCMDLLKEADLLKAVQAQNYQVKKGAIFRRGPDKSVFRFSQQHTRGWAYAYQVPRDHFDARLAHAVARRGVPVLFGRQVVGLDRKDRMWRVSIQKPDGGREQILAGSILDASGYGRVLPRLLGLTSPSGLPGRTAMFCHVSEDPGDPEDRKDSILIATHPDRHDVWYWTIPFNDGRTSVGVVCPPDWLARLPEDPAIRFRALIEMEPNNALRLHRSGWLFEPRTITAYSHSVSKLHGDGFAILGHAGEFLDPVFSSGVALSMKSAVLAAAARSRELDGLDPLWSSAFEKEFLRGVDVFKTFVEAWYSGVLQSIIYSSLRDEGVAGQLCSIFAGYAWDGTNPITVQCRRYLPLLGAICDGARVTAGDALETA